MSTFLGKICHKDYASFVFRVGEIFENLTHYNNKVYSFTGRVWGDISPPQFWRKMTILKVKRFCDPLSYASHSSSETRWKKIETVTGNEAILFTLLENYPKRYASHGHILFESGRKFIKLSDFSTIPD